MVDEHPIIFSAPMVRAILEGRKTQTRRVVRPQPQIPAGTTYMVMPDSTLPGVCPDGTLVWGRPVPKRGWMRSPYGGVSDRLWVRETWAADPCYDHLRPADIPKAALRGIKYDFDIVTNWHKRRPSIHMPRWASRLTLRATEIRVQRVQKISQEDAIDEGIQCMGDAIQREDDKEYILHSADCCQETFAHLWDEINDKPGRTWGDNPWVWAVTFEKETS